MRSLCGVLAVLLVLFAAVQYNDSDALFWISAYGAGAVLCGLAALRPRVLRRRTGRAAIAASVVLAGVGVVIFWPEGNRWWSIAEWWPEVAGEASREGMGMMILFGALLAAATVALWRP